MSSNSTTSSSTSLSSSSTSSSSSSTSLTSSSTSSSSSSSSRSSSRESSSSTSSTPTSSPPPTTTPPPTSTPSESVSTSKSVFVSDGKTQTIISYITSTAPPQTGSATSSSTSPSVSPTAGLQASGASSGGGGLSRGGVVAVAVVVPIVAVTLLVLAALFLWRKRKARKDAEELRRKEVEEYGYNPNNDPTLPALGGSAGNDGPFEMREDGASGYRGWGTTTAVGSSGRKASTTISGSQSAGGIGFAYSDGSPTQGPMSDTRSDNLLIGEGHPNETEALGAMGPAASGNRNSDINRGLSNASSYSAAGRSDGSGEMGGYGGGQYYNNQYEGGNPYAGETAYGSPPERAEMPAQPVIRDVQARRNTRIENPAHFPQQSAGIAQNF